MPYRRKRSSGAIRRRRTIRRYRRKTIRSSRRSARTRVVRPTTVGRSKAISSVFPDRFRAKLRYATLFSVTNSPRARIVIRGNSVYDPEYATGGLQPYGYDRLAQIYGRYYVHSSAIKVQFIPYATISSTYKFGDVDIKASTCEVGVYPALSAGDIAPSSLSVVDICEYPYYHGKTMFANKPVFAKGYMSTQKMVGYKAFPETTLQSIVQSNPSQQWYWNICCDSLDLVASNAKCWVKIVVTYYVSFFNRDENNLRDDEQEVDPE